MSVILARLRNNCSNLNNDLFRNHIRTDSCCPHCGHIEDAEHYFFKCTTYRTQRLTLFNSTRSFHPLSTHRLLYGDERLSHVSNIIIVKAVQYYIKESKRFA